MPSYNLTIIRESKFEVNILQTFKSQIFIIVGNNINIEIIFQILLIFEFYAWFKTTNYLVFFKYCIEH